MTQLPPLPKVRDLGGAEFEKLMNQLLLASAAHNHFDYEPHGKSGAADDGIDGLAPDGGVPGLKGPVAFQFKWLSGSLSKPANARQITKSLADAVSSKLEFRHWVLVTPEDISPAQKEWLRELNPRLDLKLHHWGHAKITSLFRLCPELRAEYYPETTRAAAADKATGKLLAAYLDWLIKDSAPLKLRAIDQGAARSGRKPLGLTSVYVDLELTLRIPKNESLPTWLNRLPEEKMVSLGSRNDPEREARRVPVLEALAHHPRLVLLGAPGSGKSTLAAYLSLSLGEAAQGRKKSLARLGKWWQAGPLPPVRIVLREFAASLAHLTNETPPRSADWQSAVSPTGSRQTSSALAAPADYQSATPQTASLRYSAGKPVAGRTPNSGSGSFPAKGRAQHLWDFLAAELQRLGLAAPTAAALQQIARDSGALFLLDGLDEAREAATRDRVLEAVTEFAATAGPRCRFLLTTRPYAWEQATAAQADWPVSYQLAEFDPPQIETFIGHWFQAVQDVGWIGAAEAQEKIASLRAAVRRADLQPLAANPLLLTLMATLLANRYRLPDDRADLYDEVVKLLLQRWAETTGADRGLLDALAVPGLTLDHVREVMQQLAFEAHAKHAGQEGVANIHEGELIAVLRPLLGDAGKAELALEYIEKRAGLLLGQGPRGHERQYTFPHRTFQEYLAACWLADQPDFPQRAVDLARANPAHWREVLTFAARQAKVGRGVPAADALVHCQSVAEWSKENQPTETDWRAAVLAGEQLLEIGLAAVNVQEIHRAVRRRVAGWIGAALGSGTVLPACDSATVRLACSPAGTACPAGSEQPPQASRPEALLHSPDSGTALPACSEELPQASRRDALLHYLPVAERDKAGAVLARLGDERKGVGVKNGVPDIEWIVISPAPFTMGEDDEAHSCAVIQEPFAISRYPVTVAQYQAFVDAGGYGEKRLWTDAGWKWKQAEKIAGPGNFDPVFQTQNHPRVGVSWFECVAFCRWLAELTKLNVRLPSEAEWERAARHTDGRKFPWGNEDEAPRRCNMNETGLGHTSAVGMFPDGNAVCGAADMAGNAWEWMRSAYASYPYVADDGRENLDASRDDARVLRGGAWSYDADDARCAFRSWSRPGDRDDGVGFRLVASPFFPLNSE